MKKLLVCLAVLAVTLAFVSFISFLKFSLNLSISVEYASMQVRINNEENEDM